MATSPVPVVGGAPAPAGPAPAPAPVKPKRVRKAKVVPTTGTTVPTTTGGKGPLTTALSAKSNSSFVGFVLLGVLVFIVAVAMTLSSKKTVEVSPLERSSLIGEKVVGSKISVYKLIEVETGPTPKIEVILESHCVDATSDGHEDHGVREIPQPVAEPPMAPQAQAPAKPKVDWPTETIDGTVEKPQPPKKARPEPSFTQQQPTPKVECWELCRDQWGNLHWMEVRVAPQAQQMRYTTTPASVRDIRYRAGGGNDFQMR